MADSAASSSIASPGVAGIILAAGESRRMGSDKALLPLGHETFLQHLIHLLGPYVSPLVVVLGSHADEIERGLGSAASAPADRNFIVLRNPDYALGQLSSLQAALRHLAGFPVRAALVALVDHPAITAKVVAALLERFEARRAPVLIPVFRGRRGHPVLFAQPLFQELLDAPLDEGARYVVRRHATELELVETDEDGILLDVDYPADYQALLRRLGAAANVPPKPPQ